MPDPPRLELDAVLRCPACGGVPYRVFRRQHVQADGTGLPSWEHVLWPSTPDLPPPIDHRHLVCPDCRLELQRVAP